MSRASVSRTSPTLLGRLRQDPTDQAAWAEFVTRYSGLIYSWCQRWNVQDADTQDVTQEVLLRLANKMRTFIYDPARSFRGWLKTLTQHALHDLRADRDPARLGGGEGKEDPLHTVAARDDLLARLNEAFDLELLDEAMARVRLRVEPHTWEAFRLTALDGLSGAAAAKQLGVPVVTVFKAKSNVQKMLQAELEKLERNDQEHQP